MKFFVAILLLTTVTGHLFGQDNLKAFNFRQAKLGTEFRITIYSQSEEIASQAAVEAWQLVDALDLIFSNYKEESELSQLNEKAGSKQWINTSSDLFEVLSFSKQMEEISDGYFDVSIGPLSKLWRRAIRRKTIPSNKIITRTKQLVGADLWACSKGGYKVQLIRENMLIDLGGVAKGLIVDRVFEMLKNKGFDQILVDAGGDMRLGNPPPNQIGWTVQLEGNNKVIAVANVSIACSGDTYQYVTHKGTRYSHIVNPKTGYGINEINNVVVYAKSCMIADAVASTISICESCETQLLSHFTKRDLKIEIIQ